MGKAYLGQSRVKHRRCQHTNDGGCRCGFLQNLCEPSQQRSVVDNQHRTGYPWRQRCPALDVKLDTVSLLTDYRRSILIACGPESPRSVLRYSSTVRDDELEDALGRTCLFYEFT